MTTAFIPALHAHIANATPELAARSAKRGGRWSLRRAIAVWLAASGLLYLAWAYSALWLYWLGGGGN